MPIPDALRLYQQMFSSVLLFQAGSLRSVAGQHRDLHRVAHRTRRSCRNEQFLLLGCPVSGFICQSWRTCYRRKQHNGPGEQTRGRAANRKVLDTFRSDAVGCPPFIHHSQTSIKLTLHRSSKVPDVCVLEVVGKNAATFLSSAQKRNVKLFFRVNAPLVSATPFNADWAKPASLSGEVTATGRGPPCD